MKPDMNLCVSAVVVLDIHNVGDHKVRERVVNLSQTALSSVNDSDFVARKCSVVVNLIKISYIQTSVRL